MNSSDVHKVRKLPLFKQYYTPMNKYTNSKTPDSIKKISLNNIKYYNTKYSYNFNNKKITIKDILEKNRFDEKDGQIKYPNIGNNSNNIQNTKHSLNEIELNGSSFKKLLDNYERKAYDFLEKTVLTPSGKYNKISSFNRDVTTNIDRINSNTKLSEVQLTQPKNNINDNVSIDFSNNLNFESKAFSTHRQVELIQSSFNVTSENHESNSVFKKKISDYFIGREVGKGSYAVVKKGIHKPTNTKVAIKIYEKDKLTDTNRKIAVKKEIEILKQLNHRNVVKLYEVIENNKQILLILEFVNGLSLLSYIKAKPNRKIEEKMVKRIFIQIIKAMKYAHKKGITHGDIKLENVLLDDKNNVKIIDFGFGSISCNLLNCFCGTPSYMPPEIIRRKEYIGSKADVWSLGILLYTLVCGYFPFRAISEKELYGKITKGIYVIPEYLSVEAKSLIQKILIMNPDERITVDEILLDAWFK